MHDSFGITGLLYQPCLDLNAGKVERDGCAACTGQLIDSMWPVTAQRRNALHLWTAANKSSTQAGQVGHHAGTHSCCITASTV